MKIAFTFNLQRSSSEEQAEFDSPDTVALISGALTRCGHVVRQIDVSCEVATLIAQLRDFGPDLIFNTAEGEHGRWREAFYPALFEQLGIPFTGSDAYTCGLTLDKHLTKIALRDWGVPMPRSVFLNRWSDASCTDGMRYPLIVKPNFEGSSIGVTQKSIVESAAKLRACVGELLDRFPDGVLVEEYVVGRDLVVPYLEAAPTEYSGVLEPATYSYRTEITGDRAYPIYDLSLKLDGYDGLRVEVPGTISAAVRDRVSRLACIVVEALGIRDVARLDFRLARDETPYFLEINALPSLEHGASLFLSGALAGLDSAEAVIGAIVRSAARRYGIEAPCQAPSNAHELASWD